MNNYNQAPIKARVRFANNLGLTSGTGIVRAKVQFLIYTAQTKILLSRNLGQSIRKSYRDSNNPHRYQYRFAKIQLTFSMK